MKHIRTIYQTRLRMPEASIRYIAHVSRCSRPAARQYLELFKVHPITAGERESMNDQQLAQHLGIEARSIQETSDNQRLGQWLDTNQQRLHEKHMTRRLLHEYYQAEVPDGLSYSQFCLVLQRRIREPEAGGMFDHKAGDKLYIDFTGKKFDWQEENGPAHTEEVYLAVLGASSCFCALLGPNQKQETFAAATCEAFGYFGGVPHAVVPDCLKSAVLSHDGYEPVHNPLFQRMLDHYGVGQHTGTALSSQRQASRRDHRQDRLHTHAGQTQRPEFPQQDSHAESLDDRAPKRQRRTIPEASGKPREPLRARAASYAAAVVTTLRLTAL